MIVDTVMFRDEFLMLECRLTEIAGAVDYVVCVEADVDHQDHPKPYLLTENRERFTQWADKLVIVRAKDLPTATDQPDPWAREHAQREWCAVGLQMIGGVSPHTVVLHGDLDEIPTAVAARNVRPRGVVAFEQRGHFFALDWLHPEPWRGTVAARAGDIRSFGALRDARNVAKSIPDAGWHLSWLGSTEENLAKLNAFCHPEIAQRTEEGLTADRFRAGGWHVDGRRMIPVDVDHTWPRWVRDGNAPESWYRPRGLERENWSPPTGFEHVR